MTYGNSEVEGNLGLDWMSSESFTNEKHVERVLWLPGHSYAFVMVT